VLVLAAAALCEHGAGRRGTVGRRLDDIHETGALHMLAGFGALGLDRLAGQYEGRQHDLAIDAAEALAAINQFFDADVRIHAGAARFRRVTPSGRIMNLEFIECPRQ
jgi:hypothetical protein